MGGCKQKQKKKGKEVKLARDKRVEESKKTHVEESKVKKCDPSDGDKDKIELLLNKVVLLETKIEELEDKERTQKDKQEKAAKVNAELQQDVRTVRKTMENQQMKLQVDLASVKEYCAKIEENLSKVKQEQDNLNNQLKGLLILERIERSQRTNITNPVETRKLADNCACREIFPQPCYHAPSCSFSKAGPTTSNCTRPMLVPTPPMENSAVMPHPSGCVCREKYSYSQPDFHSFSCPVGKSDTTTASTSASLLTVPSTHLFVHPPKPKSNHQSQHPLVIFNSNQQQG